IGHHDPDIYLLADREWLGDMHLHAGGGNIDGGGVQGRGAGEAATSRVKRCQRQAVLPQHAWITTIVLYRGIAHPGSSLYHGRPYPILSRSTGVANGRPETGRMGPDKAAAAGPGEVPTAGWLYP